MRKLALVLVSIIVVALCWGIMLATDADRHILQTSFIEEVLEETPLAEAASMMLAEQMSEEIPPDVPPIFREQIPIAFKEVFDAQWVERTILGLSDELLAVMRGDKEHMTATVDISNEKGLLYDQLITQLEELSDDQLETHGMRRMELDMMMGMVSQEQLLGGIPDQFDVSELLEGADLPMSIEELQSQYQIQRGRIQIVMIITIPVAIILYILLAGLAGAFRWAGWSLIIAGALYLIAFVILRTMLPGVAEQVELPPGIDPAAIAAVVRSAVNKFMFSPMVTVAIGVILVVLSIFIPRWRKTAQE